jgi:hypothetical protein
VLFRRAQGFVSDLLAPLPFIRSRRPWLPPGKINTSRHLIDYKF